VVFFKVEVERSFQKLRWSDLNGAVNYKCYHR